MISLKSKEDIKKLAAANAIVAKALALGRANAKVGVSLVELDSMIEDFILASGAKPAFKGLYGFTHTACLSLNEVVIHGIPSEYRLQEGDILGIDVGTNLGGYYGDGAITMGIGNISKEDEALIACAKDTLYEGISSIKVGMRFKELSAVLEAGIRSRGFVPLLGFCGHGIGRGPHEEPEIPNYVVGSSHSGPKIKNGMVFCLEPMVCQKNSEYQILEDKWGVVSTDGLNTAHYEHAVAIIDGAAVILTEE